MTDPSKTIFSIPPKAPIAWPPGWPEGVALLVRVIAGRPSFFPCHVEEDGREVLARMGEAPDSVVTPGFVNGAPVSPEVVAAVMRVETDEDVLDAASDFYVNYAYAKSEGVALEIPPPVTDAPVTSQAPAPAPQPAPEIWPQAAAAADTRILTGATLRRSVAGDIAIDVPLYQGVEEIALADIRMMPGTSGIVVTAQAWDGMPGTILLPGEIARHLDVPEGEGVRIVKTPQWISFSRDTSHAPSFAQTLQEERDSPAEPPRARRRVTGLAILIAVAATVGVIFWNAPEETADTVQSLREQLFSTRP